VPETLTRRQGTSRVGPALESIAAPQGPLETVDTQDLAPLIAQCRAGDPLAWEAFVRQFQSRVYGLACTYVRDRDDAADLAQEIFVRLFETRARWVPDREFVPWMFQVARNRAVDFLRRRRVRRPAVAVPAESAAELADPGEGPEARVLRRSRLDQFRAALARLSDLSREILVLRDVQGLSVREVAAALGVPDGTVKSRASRARAELAEQLLAASGERSDR
jgi:RNA polymerase sigma-70 factor, ECF subfamily